MAALLKQLQKKKNVQVDARKAVVRSAADELSLSFDSEIESMLEDLNIAKGPTLNSASSNLQREARSISQKTNSYNRSNKSEKFNTGVPWWLRQANANSASVDAILKRVVPMIVLKNLPSASNDCLRELVRQKVAESMVGDLRFSRKVADRCETELLALLIGKSILSPAFQDPLVTQIFVDAADSIKVVRDGVSFETTLRFRSVEEYHLFVSSLLMQLNKTLSREQPVINGILNDNWRTRVNLLDASLHEGRDAKLSFVIPRSVQMTMYDALQLKIVPPTIAAWLSEVVAIREANILVIGQKRSGKTLMAGALLSAVSSNERIVSIEHVPEICIPTANMEKLNIRPDSLGGEAGVSADVLLEVAMQRSPDRIVLGEIFGKEAKVFLQAIESGFVGALATMQSSSAADAMWKFLDLVGSIEHSSEASLVRRISRNINLLILMGCDNDQPCLMEVAEVIPSSDSQFYVQPIVRYLGASSGKRQWQLVTRESYWMNRIKESGLSLMPGPGVIAAKDLELDKEN